MDKKDSERKSELRSNASKGDNNERHVCDDQAEIMAEIERDRESWGRRYSDAG